MYVNENLIRTMYDRHTVHTYGAKYGNHIRTVPVYSYTRTGYGVVQGAVYRSYKKKRNPYTDSIRFVYCTFRITVPPYTEPFSRVLAASFKSSASYWYFNSTHNEFMRYSNSSKTGLLFNYYLFICLKFFSTFSFLFYNFKISFIFEIAFDFLFIVIFFLIKLHLKSKKNRFQKKVKKYIPVGLCIFIIEQDLTFSSKS